MGGIGENTKNSTDRYTYILCKKRVYEKFIIGAL
tara:strand:- start:643 stop:744 length:102 start_codon:yes stop_codon:yes gene_type:complete